jgi:hypothetical protein
MNKIIHIALSTKFSEEIIGTLEEIIANTPNPEHATALLLGIYEEPEIKGHLKLIRDVPRTFISYNPWTNYVTYSYLEEQKEHIYIKEDTDTSLITSENYKDFEVRYSSNVKGFHIKTGEMIKRTDSINVDNWNASADYVEDNNMSA